MQFISFSSHKQSAITVKQPTLYQTLGCKCSTWRPEYRIPTFLGICLKADHYHYTHNKVAVLSASVSSKYLFENVEAFSILKKYFLRVVDFLFIYLFFSCCFFFSALIGTSKLINLKDVYFLECNCNKWNKLNN